MTPEQYDTIKQYVGFTADSAALLQRLHGVAEPSFVRIVDDFYDAIVGHPQASRTLTGGSVQIARLKQTLVAWLRDVLLGPHDAAHLERHLRIGRRHVQIGLPQEFMFTAMNRIRGHFMAITKESPISVEERSLQVDAINQVLDLELSIMLDSYREDLLAQMRVNERRELAEAVPALVLGLDGELRIVLWNQALESLTGFAREQMLGQPGAHLFSDTEDVRLPLKAGGYRTVRWQAAEGGEGLRYAIGVDVTEETEMLRRTLRAERLAAVGTLAAGLAHEVRNPLNSAILQLQVLRRRIERSGADRDALLPVCEIVLHEIRRLDQLVTDFLAFSRPHALELGATDLGEVVTAVAELFQPEANLASIELFTEVASDTGPVEADAERIRQVLVNLLKNALEAIGNGGVVRMVVKPAPSYGFVDLEVHDTGPGFPEEARIFDAFYTTKHSGTGLGLAIAHRIVSDHGGSISVSSEPGHTCFAIRLPRWHARSP
jgi:PAS domain S-box-containing protein